MIRLEEMERSYEEPRPPSEGTSPVDALARRRFIDLPREPPGWLVTIHRFGPGGRFLARRLNSLLVWKSGRPVPFLVREYWFEIISITVAAVISLGVNVWLWRRP